MPQVPTGQHVTDGWPVLDLGTKPDIPLAQWSLRVDGAVEEPLRSRLEGASSPFRKSPT